MTLPLKLLRDIALVAPMLAVIHDTSESDYTGYVAAAGYTMWARVAGLPQAPQAWPEADVYKSILLPLPRNRESLNFCLAACGSVLARDGTLYLFGSNALGIKSAERQLREYFAKVEQISVGHHGRLYSASAPLQLCRSLGDFAESELFAMPDGDTVLTVYPCLFAKGKLDPATALLLQNLPEIKASSNVLDFACGTGVIASAVRQRQPACKVTLVDHDPLALLAAAANVTGAHTICCADPAAIKGSYDLILSNPPIHTGATLDHGIVESLICGLPRLLTQTGVAYLVTQRTVPVAQLAAKAKLAATEVAASPAFRVTKVVKS